ncbi:dual specificity protein phosphatase 14 isoform X1 [Photinus pyralis]|nr:dual specificity protein phosphatase 14 isoform X1 [Photinus pyralis]
MEFINVEYVFNGRKDNEVQDILSKSVETVSTSSSESSCTVDLNLNITEVTRSLFLCSATSVHTSTLQLLGVSFVINATVELPDTPLPEKTVKYYRIRAFDSPNQNIRQYFDISADLIHQISLRDGKTLIHCTAGVSRSATLCIAYLMKYHKLSLIESYNYLKLRRPIIKPNCGFFRQLIEYERELFGNNTVKLVYNEMLNLELPDVYDCEYKSLNHFRKKYKKSAD